MSDTNNMEHTSLQTLGDKELYDFLLNCPKDFKENERIRKFQLKNGDYIHCVLWNFHFYISGTDIVKVLIWRFQNAGRPIGALKKFEEGIFSDLRNLKPGVDATLEGPRSEFLEFLYKNGCIRTQKKQKVFYWYSVPHDELFFDALERDMRRDSSIYTYNRLMHNPQQMRRPGAGIMPGFGSDPAPASFEPHPAYMPAHRMPQRPIEPMTQRPGDYSIKDALFGALGAPTEGKPGSMFAAPGDFMNGAAPQDFYSARGANVFTFGSDPFVSGMPPRMADPSGGIPPGFQPAGSEIDLTFVGGSAKTPSSSASSSTSAEQATPSCAKRGLDKMHDFDDFDLGQFDFLKERCKEHFARKGEACEQKRFEEPKTDEKISPIDRMGEIRFVGSKDRN